MAKSIKTKLNLATAGALILAVLIAEAVSSFLHYSFLKRSVQSKLAAVAAANAAHIDVALHESLHKPEDMERSDYKAVVMRLNQLLKSDPSVKFIYTLRPVAAKGKGANKKPSYEFVLDGGSIEHPPGSDNPDFSKIGDPYDKITINARSVFKTGKSVSDPEVVKDQWGWTISGYAPLKDKSGKVVAILGVDMTADELAHVMSTIYWSAGGAAVGAALLGIILASLLMRALMQPLDMLRRAAERVSSGQLNEPIKSRREDEFALVFATFNRMMHSIDGSRQLLVQQARMESEMRLAATVQSQLFQWERIERDEVILGNFVQMADSTGGDWAHYHLARDRYLYMICGDVVGHGLPSALVVSAVAGCFESLKTDLDSKDDKLSVREIMLRVHSVVQAAGRGNFPMTMFLIKLDLQDGKVAYGCAGHPPARVISVSKDGTRVVRRLKGRADYLGSPVSGEVGVHEDQLVPGDFIVLFSDGLVERRDIKGRSYGMGRFDRYLRTTKADTPRAMCEEILGEISGFVGQTKIEDDISLLTARYLGNVRNIRAA